MSAFTPGGVAVSAGSGVNTITLDGVGDAVKVAPNTSGNQIAVNDVWGGVNESVIIRIPFGATTVVVNGGSNGARVTRGSVG